MVDPSIRTEGISAVLKIVVKCPFYHLFGENWTDDEDERSNRSQSSSLTSNNLCWPEKDKDENVLVSLFIPTLRGLYLLTSVILLLNLLIAMFNSSIVKVEQRSERLWYLYRRNVIFENWNRSCFPFAPYLLFVIFMRWIYVSCSKENRKEGGGATRPSIQKNDLLTTLDLSYLAVYSQGLANCSDINDIPDHLMTFSL